MNYSVLYACNDAYAPFAGVSIHSLLDSNRDAEEIDIYLVENNVSVAHLNQLKAEVGSFGPTRHLHTVDATPYIEQMKAGVIPSYRGLYTANLRLFFEHFIDPACERLLYLDCDTLVVGSLAELFSMDFGGKPAAVVRESLTGMYHLRIGFSVDDPYFNSGVLCVDVPNWKAQNCTALLFEMMQDPRHRHMNPDQDLLNILLKDNLVWLLPRYNLQPSHMVYSDRTYFHCYPVKNYYTKEEITFSRRHPVILHTYRFCGQCPWHKHSIHPAAAEWRKNLAASMFAELPPVENKGFLFALERMLYRILPKRWFFGLFRRAQSIASKRKIRQLQKEFEAEKKEDVCKQNAGVS